MAHRPGVLRAAAALALLAALAAACLPPARGQGPMVFAAASLRNALDEVNERAGQRAGARAIVSYAASSTLARQIASGAPADVFLPADLEWMDYVAARKLVRSGTRANLLRNELVLIAPAASRGQVTIAPRFPLAAALGGGRLAIGDPAHVPAGKYARAALETLGVWRAVADRLAPAENVRAALNFVSRGEAPLGIVYRTDAAADAKVRVVAVFPADSHPPIVYPVAGLVTGRSSMAAAYLDYLGSAAAAAIFVRHGFVPIRQGR